MAPISVPVSGRGFQISRKCGHVIGIVVLLASARGNTAADGPVNSKKTTERMPTWCEKYLRAMKEPDLEALLRNDRTVAIYRFTWLPSFHNPISVRYETSAKGVIRSTVVLSGPGGYEPGIVALRTTVNLSPARWNYVRSRLGKANFWGLPTHERPQLHSFDTDGDMLIVEGSRIGKYHVVVRQCPPKSPFVELCQAMLFTSGVDMRQLWFEYRQ